MGKNLLAIEYHPENGHSPWVVVSTGKVRIWWAYRTREDAEERLSDKGFVERIASLERAA